MLRKGYNPYMIKSESINRFRGVVNPENQQTINKMYVGESNNVECFRWGELSCRSGQLLRSI